MNKSEFGDFNKLWSAALETYGKDPSDLQIGMAYSLLEKYPFDAIKRALIDHMSSSDAGRFMPKPADIIGNIEKLTPTVG